MCGREKTSWCTFLGFDLTRGSKYSLCRFLTTAVFCNIWIWIVIWLLKAPRVFSFSVRFFISEKQKPSEIPKCLIEIHSTWFAGLSFLRVSPISAPTSLDVSNVGTLWTVVLAAALWRNYLDGFLLGEVNANLRENGFKFFNSLVPSLLWRHQNCSRAVAQWNCLIRRGQVSPWPRETERPVTSSFCFAWNTLQKRPQTLQAMILTLCSMISRLFLQFWAPKMPPKYWPFWSPGVFFKRHLFGTWQFSRFGVAGSRKFAPRRLARNFDGLFPEEDLLKALRGWSHRFQEPDLKISRSEFVK